MPGHAGTAADLMSVFDAVDGSSTGTRVPKMWALFKAPTIWRSYPCKRFRQLVSTSPSRFFRFMAWMLAVWWLSAGS